MEIDFDDIERYISQVETDFFTGSFCESVIRDDLQTRKAMDSYSTLGSRGIQTERLGEKQNIYIQDFDNTLNIINQILNWTDYNRSWDSEFISRCEKCKKQLNRLRDIVRIF